MEITFAGTGTLQPNDRAHTSLLLEDDPLLFDCGAGVLQNIVDSDVEYEAIDRVLISHRHPDHVCGLVPLLLARGGLTIYGPPHTRRLVDELLEPFPDTKREVSVDVHEVDQGETFTVGDRTIETMETIHDVHSMAYRIDDAFVYSGDTAPMEAMATFAAGCDLLVHECSSVERDGGGNWHSNPFDLASVVAECDVDQLYLVHVGSLTDAEKDDVRDAIGARFDGEIAIPDDLDTVSIPT